MSDLTSFATTATPCPAAADRAASIARADADHPMMTPLLTIPFDAMESSSVTIRRMDHEVAVAPSVIG